MWQHFNDSHFGHFKQAKTDEKLLQCASTSASASATSVADLDIIKETGESEISSQFVSNSSQQLRILVLFKRHLPLSHTSSRWRTISDLMCYFIAKGMRPLHTVNKPGFRKLLNVIEPRYEPQDRKTLANNYVHKMYSMKRRKSSCWIVWEMLTTTQSLQIFGHHVKVDRIEQPLHQLYFWPLKQFTKYNRVCATPNWGEYC